MTTLPTVRDTAPDLSANEFEVGYIAGDGTRHRVPLADVRAVLFEAMAPIRRFNTRKGQRHPPGRWWSATDGRHVGYESWLERDYLTWLDWDRAVVGIASQPFRLSWAADEGQVWWHVPDFSPGARAGRRW